MWSSFALVQYGVRLCEGRIDHFILQFQILQELNQVVINNEYIMVKKGHFE